MAHRIAIDIGGTFTDLLHTYGRGVAPTAKVPLELLLHSRRNILDCSVWLMNSGAQAVGVCY